MVLRHAVLEGKRGLVGEARVQAPGVVEPDVASERLAERMIRRVVLAADELRLERVREGLGVRIEGKDVAFRAEENRIAFLGRSCSSWSAAYFR